MADAGDVVGDYRLEQLLGTGGFGSVWVGVSRTSGARVAVKLLDRMGAEASAVRTQLMAEAAALRSVSSPHTLQVLDVVDDGTVVALVTDLVVGAPLRSIVDLYGRLSGTDALIVLRDAALGLAAVHDAGLIHADVKPANILVEASGRSKLIDFGLVSLPGWVGEDSLSPWGSPAYAPPELVMSNFRDHRSDIYSLTVTLFELLCGRRPFEGDTVDEVRSRHVYEALPDPRWFVPDLGDELTQLLMWGLSKDPDARPQDVRTWLHYLEAAAQTKYGDAWLAPASVGGMVGGMAAGGMIASGVLAGGGATAVAAGSAVGGAGAAGGVGAAVAGGGATSTAIGGAASTTAAVGGVKAAVVAGAVAVAAVGGGGAAYIVKHDSGAAPVAASYTPGILAAYQEVPPEGTGPTPAYVVRNDGTTVVIKGMGDTRNEDVSSPSVRLAATPDGRYVAAVDGDSMTVVDGTDPTRQWLVDCLCTAVAFDKDGKLVALQTDDSMTTYVIGDKGVTQAASVKVSSPGSLATRSGKFHADKIFGLTNDFAYVALPGKKEDWATTTLVSKVDRITGAATTVTDLGVSYVGKHAMSADGRYLAMETGPGDGCAGSALLTMDLSKTPVIGATDNGPQAPGAGESATNFINDVSFDGSELAVNWSLESDCSYEVEPPRAYRAGLPPLGPASGGFFEDAPMSWDRSGEEVGVLWERGTHDGRRLSLWQGDQDAGNQLWLGDPDTDGQRLAEHVGNVISVGPSKRVAPVAAKAVVDINPWDAQGNLKPGYRIQDWGDGTAIDCTYDKGSPVSTSPGTHWCGDSADYKYACWNDPTSGDHMVCLTDPWQRTLDRVSVENFNPDTSAKQEADPFGVELADGSRCRYRIGGAWGATPPGTGATYGCSAPTNDPDSVGWILLTSEDEPTFLERDGTMTALAYKPNTSGDDLPENQPAPQRVEVKTTFRMVAGS